MKPLISRLAGHLLEVFAPPVGLGAHIHRMNVTIEPEALRQAADKGLVFVRLVSAKLVVQVGDRQRDIQVRGQFPQHVQKRYRVGPARHSDSHPVAGSHHPVLGDRLCGLTGHVFIVGGTCFRES